MLLTLLNNTAAQPTANLAATCSTSASQPQVHPLAAGAAVVFAAVISGSIAPPAQYTFGSHAVQTYNAEALKSQVWSSVPQSGGGLITKYRFGNAAAALYNAEAQKSQVWAPAAAPAITIGILGAYVSAPPGGAEWLFQPSPQTQAPFVAGPGILGSYTWAWPGQSTWQPSPQYSAAVIAGPGILGAFASAAPQDAPKQFEQTPFAWAPLNAGPGFLGAFVAGAPQEQPKQHPPSLAVRPTVAGPGVLGTFVEAAPQEQPKQTPPVWMQAPLSAGPGILGAFVGSYQQDGVKQTPPALVWTPTVNYHSGFLGSFVGVGTPQSQVQPPPQVQRTLTMVPPPPVAAPFYYATGQFQDRPTNQAWAATVAGPGFLGKFAWAIGQDPTQVPAQLRAPLTAGSGFLGRFAWAVGQDPTQQPAQLTAPLPAGSGFLGRFIFSAPAQSESLQLPAAQWSTASKGLGGLGVFVAAFEQRQDRPTTQSWTAALGEAEQVLGSFVYARGMLPEHLQPLALFWAPVNSAPGRLASFVLVAEQQQDRPTVQSRGALMLGPITPAGVVAEIVAWAESQTGVQGARSSYLDGSGCFVFAEYFDEFGNPSVPAAVSYRVDDKLSGLNIVPWTPLVPAVQNRVVVTSAQNAMISLSRTSETHQVLFKVTDGFGVIDTARVLFDLIRAPVS